MNTTNGRAVLYARISEDTTGEALGVARQLEHARELAASHGWTVVAEATDNNISALRGAHRPGYEEVLRLVRAGEVDYVVVWQTSRLLRNRLERAQAIELFGHQRVGIMAVKGVSLDLTTAYGRTQAGLMGEFDTMESEVKAERVAAAAADRAKRGRPSGDLGYGWEKRGSGSGAVYVERPHEAAVVREIVDRLLAGETLRAVTASLNERGEPAPKTPTWGKTSVKKLAMRESNISVRVHHRGRPDETRFVGDWPALVDETKHAKVCALLSEPTRRKNGGTATNPTRPGARRWLLSWGVGECGVCGAHLRVVHRKTPRYGQPMHYYTCDANGCVGRKVVPVDEFIRGIVIARLSRPDALDWMLGDDEEARRLTEQVADLRRRLDEAADLFATQAIDAQQLARITGDLRPQLEQADAKRRQAATSLDLDVLRPLAGPTAEAAWDAMAVSQQRAVLETLRLRVVINKTRPGPGFDPASVAVLWEGRNA